MPDHEKLIATLREQEESLVLATFDQADAWSLGRRMAETALAAGLPAGVFNVLHGDGTTGEALLRSEAIRGISFTGSQAGIVTDTAAVPDADLLVECLREGFAEIVTVGL